MAASYASFSIPSNYIHGTGSMESVSKFCRGKTVIVTDVGIMEAVGHLQQLTGVLSRAGIEIAGLISIENEPSFSDLRDAEKKCSGLEPDTIIALGGGAVIDTAKVLYYTLLDPAVGIDVFIEQGPGTPELLLRNRPESPNLAVIPTTSGTGSEVTCAAVFSDIESGTKKLYLSPLFIPETAILDPLLTLSLPPAVTAQSGFDALTHAIESYLCTIATPFSRAMSIRAVSLLADNLLKAVGDGSDIEARKAMLYGSSMAGIAISNSCTGLAHSLDQVGSVFKIPHGAAMSPLLLPILEMTASRAPGLLDGLSLALKLDGTSSEERSGQLLARLREIIVNAGLPGSFSALGADRTEYERTAELIVPGALEAFATKTFPLPVDRDALMDILNKAY